jgi:hypothetical protein
LSFDDLFTLLIVVIFIGLPLLNRLRGGGPQRRPGAPGRPVDPRTRPQGPSRPVGGGPVSAGGRDDDRDRELRDDSMDELSRRLEEARRRVREAMGEEPQASRDRPLVSGPPTQSVAGAGMPSGTAGGAPRPTAPAPPRQAPPRQSPPAQSPSQRQPPAAGPHQAPVRRTGAPPEAYKRTGRRPPGFARSTPALEVERSPGRGALGSPQAHARRERARRETAALVAMDPESIRKGLLWHMILGQPAAFERGRMRSPRPSR